jgi:D-alanine-D-alanine ligase
MARKKLRVGVLFGGKSGEHDISLRSARSILDAIDRKKFEVVELGINKQGRWLGGGAAQGLLKSGEVATDETGLAIAAGAEPEIGAGLRGGLDVVFPVLHGTFGEDGTIQGLFELADIAYVGSGVLGSAAGMDKDAMKRMFFAAGLPLTPHVTLLRSEWKADAKKCVRAVEKALRYPVFVKPANLGSSVGISKVKVRGELGAAIDLAASFDRKIVIEQGVGGPGVKPRELEVAVLGNDAPEASVVGEIVPAKEFYDYEAKYELSGADESVSIIPAKLSKAEEKKIRGMAIAAFRACDCSGLARVDFLMSAATKGRPAELVLNEVNTMPGFTSISMYPKLWAASGVSYPKLIERLIELALERHKEKLETSFSR